MVEFFHNFLSHLCGEEECFSGCAIACVFLSHLCGEEELANGQTFVVEFLSHLCGEEASIACL